MAVQSAEHSVSEVLLLLVYWKPFGSEQSLLSGTAVAEPPEAVYVTVV